MCEFLSSQRRQRCSPCRRRREARHPIGFFQPVDCANVGMVERGEQARFTREARAALGVSREVGGQDLDCDVTPELRVTRAIDIAHPAGPKRCDDRVGAELTADHLSFI